MTLLSGSALLAGMPLAARADAEIPERPRPILDTAIWEAVGPFGGRVDNLTVDSDGSVFAGMTIGRLFRRSPEGGNWRAACWGLPENTSIDMLAAGSASAGTMLAQLSWLVNWSPVWSLYKTIDSGGHWVELHNPSPTRRASSIALDPSRPGYAYVGSSVGFFRSTDGGSTWARAGSGLPNHGEIRSLTPVPRSPGVLFAIAREIAYRTDDFGNTWQPVTLGAWFTPASFEVDPLADATLYVCGSGGVLKSTDGGMTWLPSNKGLPSARLLWELVMDPLTAGTIYAVGDEKLYKSLDGAASWKRLSTPYRWFSGPLAVDTVVPGRLYAGGSAAGLFVSDNGGATWHLETIGLSAISVRSIALDPSVSDLIYVATEEGLYRSRTAGTKWSRLTKRIGQCAFVAVDAEHPPTIYASDVWQERSLFTSHDRGETWRRIGERWSMGVPDPQSFTFGSSSATLYAAVSWFLFRSSDQGTTWGVLDSAPFGIQALASDESRSGTLYAGGYGLPPLSKSTDGGRSWTAISTGLGREDVTCVLVDPSSAETLYVGTADAGVFKTSDGGATWAPARSGLGLASVSYLISVPDRSSLLFAATRDAGVFVSSNRAGTWRNLSVGLPSAWVNQIALDPHDSRTLYAATESNGAYRLRFDQLPDR